MPRPHFGLAAAALAMVLAGCGTTAPTSTPTPTPAAGQDTPVAVTEPAGPAATEPPPADESPTAEATEDDDPTSLEDAVIEPDGVGPIRVGVSLAEAQAHGWTAMNELCQRWDASPALLEQGLSLTFVDDQLYEIWVHQPTFATAEGVKVGDTLDDVKQAYGDDLQTEEREGGGGRLPAWFVVEDEHELLFVEQDPGRDNRIKAILARTHGTEVIEGC
ncbi:MAG: hypothetical protein Q4F67_13225 [Propionibacteriaceae bacterium]|nr:hypothetical protein [Propionibacteriaceae bacterium]